MPDLKQYWDYRVYLKDLYDERKRDDWFFSYRFFGAKLGVNPGYLVKVLQGQAHLARRSLDTLIDFLKLQGSQAELLEALFVFTKAVQPSERHNAYEKIMQLKGFPTGLVQHDQSEYFRKWYYPVVRSLVGLPNEKADSESLAARLEPAISVDEAQNALLILEQLGMIRNMGKNRFELVENFVSSGQDVSVDSVRGFQRETMRLASDSLERIPKEQREISTVTVTLSLADLIEARERTRIFRESILKLSSETRDACEVYQLNIQLFPLTKSNNK